jgi:histidine ammonia-lyase
MINFTGMDLFTYEGQSLTVEDIRNCIKGKLELAPPIWKRIADNREALETLLSDTSHRYYGINTGFGTLYSVGISKEDTQQLQTNLLRSHACGTGPAAPAGVVRLTLLLKIISLARASSGVRESIVRLLLDLYNHGIIPVVPSLGSLGASGDLAPLSHLCLPLMGEGEVVYRREQMPAARALSLAGLESVQLEAKEGLALINGTQYSLALLIHALTNAVAIREIADMCAALSIDAFDGNQSPLDADIHELRNQNGQILSAAAIRKWLQSSEIHHAAKQHLQDPYSFRCAPQVHGATRDVIEYALQIASNEINAVTDNPLVIMEAEHTKIVSGGNFHAQPLALTSDFLTIALSEYASISERRSYLLLSGQRGLPAALANRPGLESGMMICQYTAASLVNRNKILAHPASTDTIVTSAGQEDHVSMAANAGLKLSEVVNHVWKVLAIEWMLAAQALEYRRPLHSSPLLEEIYAAYRTQVPALSGDRSLSTDIELTEHFLRQISH